MTVNPKTVQGRRNLEFSSLDQIVADAERLVAANNTQTVGNWSLSHLLSHLAMTVNSSIDGFTMKAPLFVRIIVPFFKKGALRNRMSPGIQLPKSALAVAYPEVASAQMALDQLRQAIARTKSERMEATHPAFGRMTHDEWVILHLRHSEMHLSFAVTPSGKNPK